MKRLLLLGLVVFPLAATQAITVKVTVTNNSPADGVGLAPFWAGFHNGSFDSYDGGVAATPALETLAEVGSPADISAVFGSGGTLVSTGTTQTGTRVQGNTGLLAQGASETLMFDVASDGSNDYFSYASMILPSSDYFIANGNPLAIDLSSILSGGGVIEFGVGLAGTILDAGTEINDFAFSAGNPLVGIPAGDAPNGADEGGVVSNVANPFAGFLNAPGGFTVGNLDFNDSAIYPDGVATVRIEAIRPTGVPEPGAALPIAALGLMAFLRRRKA